jgi:hypothetical protein
MCVPGGRRRHTPVKAYIVVMAKQPFGLFDDAKGFDRNHFVTLILHQCSLDLYLLTN